MQLGAGPPTALCWHSQSRRLDRCLRRQPKHRSPSRSSRRVTTAAPFWPTRSGLRSSKPDLLSSCSSLTTGDRRLGGHCPPVRTAGPRDLQVNQGESVARNRGLVEAAGSHVLFLDADDLIWRESLARLAGALESRGPAAVAIMGCAWFESDPDSPELDARGHAPPALSRHHRIELRASSLLARATRAGAGGWRILRYAAVVRGLGPVVARRPARRGARARALRRRALPSACRLAARDDEPGRSGARPCAADGPHGHGVSRAAGLARRTRRAVVLEWLDGADESTGRRRRLARARRALGWLARRRASRTEIAEKLARRPIGEVAWPAHSRRAPSSMTRGLPERPCASG